MGAGTHLRGGANPVRVELGDGGYERLGVLHGVHDLFFSRFIEGAHLRCSRRTRQCPDSKSEAGLLAGLELKNLVGCSAEVERDKLSIRRHTEVRATQSSFASIRPPSMSAALCRALVVAAAAPLTRRRPVASRGKVRPAPEIR